MDKGLQHRKITTQKMKADLVAFTEEILNGKLHFLCSDTWISVSSIFQSFALCKNDVEF